MEAIGRVKESKAKCRWGSKIIDVYNVQTTPQSAETGYLRATYDTQHGPRNIFVHKRALLSVDAEQKTGMVEAVRDCLAGLTREDAFVAGVEIQTRLRKYWISFEGCDTWLMLLVEKWRRKTPDMSVQAEGIVNALLNRMVEVGRN